MESSNHQFLKPFLPADDHRFEFELYTIPSSSGWFSWDNIHEIEKTSLKEFFDGSSFTRNPRVYKEYRDFIISKYREDPSRRLTFSEIRKSLVGDVNYLLKVFLFLEKWGLINFGTPSSVIGGVDCDLIREDEDEGRWKVKVEEGPPHGVRVVAIPNSLKPVQLLASLSSNNGPQIGETEFKMPPLSSHSDVYQELIELICGNCKERCESSHYEYMKDECYIICTKCFKNGSYGNNKSVDDYKFVDHTPDNETLAASWTEAETLLLLESVLKHGDNWDLVAQNVQTKSKLDCISKLLQLPFGHLMLGSTHNRRVNNGKQVHSAPQEIKDVETENKSQQNSDADIEGPPPKRICIEPVSDSSNPKTEQTDKEDEQVTPSVPFNEEIKEKDGQLCELKNQKHLPNVGTSLMQQVAHISAVVGSHVTASAAEAAVTALCDENEIPKEIFDNEENGNELSLSTQSFDSERTAQGDGLEMDARSNVSEKGVIPLPLRMRATSAIALGAAAAHAKLLAVQEDIEIERLVSSVINTQLKKLQYKMGLLNKAEVIMEKEYNQMMELEDSLLTEQMDVVQKVIHGGVSRWRDKTTVKPQEEIVL
ncbi:hypothetical protein L1987_66881 [Smallanthus sonchifolius]|uniref:Uncharacterized protein n=1 Tax=Smallanthus sonchifolius TaxID=185202 RepID=A0ACB9BYI7_9ASTR|nr:hypothetical protein L1987_66881 [Smallanthus sonchifolius]